MMVIGLHLDCCPPHSYTWPLHRGFYLFTHENLLGVSYAVQAGLQEQVPKGPCHRYDLVSIISTILH